MHDDHADAYIWAISELKGLSQASFMEAYGMDYCPECNKPNRKGKTRDCGHVLEAEPEEIKAMDERGWAAAYAQRCQQCGNLFSRSDKKCPKCSINRKCS